MSLFSLYDNCTLCPRKCGAKRNEGKPGICGSDNRLLVSRAALHMWEEPCISGTEGSGTVFFAGCNLHCLFCQNHDISGNNPYGKEISAIRLSEIFLELQEKGANNINLVTPTHYIPHIVNALKAAKTSGLSIPVVYNSGGYENVESLRLLDGLVDIYLPDFKYMHSDTATCLSSAKDYPEVAKEAIAEMVRQTVGSGENSEISVGPIFDENTGLLKKGVIVRHLVLPGHTKEACEILKYLYETYADSIYISIMNQYTPFPDLLDPSKTPKELFRKVTAREYEKVLSFALETGIKNGFTQEGKAASESFIPSFKDCEGV